MPKTLSRKFRLPLAILSLSILLAGCGPKPATEVPVRAVRTVVLDAAGGPIDREFAGDIRARIESPLAFRVGGKVVSRSVELGQTVRAGQVLAQLDVTDLRLGQDAAQAGLASAQVQAAQSEADFRRFQELRAQGFISEAELDRRQSTLKAAQAALVQARSQAGVQGNQAAYGSLTATAAGVITAVDLEPGQVVGAGQRVLTLAHDGPRDVVFAVPEMLAGEVRKLVGKSGGLKVRLWGASDWVSATVREMAASADPVSRTFQVKADASGLGATLGQTATVSLNLASRVNNGLHLPLVALAERQGRSVVWVLDPASMTVQPQPVVTAEIKGNVVMVAAGLKAGQEVVTAGVHVLQAGQKVRRLSTSAATSAAVPATAAPVPAAASAR